MLPVLALLTASAMAAQPKPQLVVVDQAVADRFGAKSLDGSPPAFYFAGATNASMANRWVLYFKGGGWCIDDVSCADRAKTDLGSSTKLAAEFDFPHGFSSGDCATNPSFCEANRVILWYTDGGSFTGNREGGVRVGSSTIWYRGHANLRAIVDVLRADHGLGSATEVLVSGGSAGGLAAYLHADELRAMVASPRLRVFKAAPASGFFLNHTSAGGGGFVYGAQMRAVFGFMNSSAGVPAACLARVGPGRGHECITAAGVWPTMATPTFVQNSAVDSWQLGCVLTSSPTEPDAPGMRCHSLPAPWTCLSSWHACPRSPVVDAMAAYRADFLAAWRRDGASDRPGFGGFVHTCVTHVGSQGDEWDGVTIGGVPFFEAARRWWEGPSDAPAANNTHLPCELGAEAPWQCNPSCGKD